MGRRAREARSGAALTAPDPFRFTTLAHAGRDLLGPVAIASLDALLARIAPVPPEPGVLDVGCGKGEMLVRALERLGGHGIGVEPNPAFAADARARIARRLPPGRAEILGSTLADGSLPGRVHGVGICAGALHAFGDWRDALAGMSRLVVPGGWALLGPGYWKRTPAADYLAAIGGSEDEQHSLATTLAMAGEAGWRVFACHESTPAEWDDYEHAYAANVRRWCEAHPDDPDAGPFRARIDGWAAAYERWGRDTMGYALVLLVRG